MFSDFAKVLSRDFVFGYFLPAALFLVVATLVFLAFPLSLSEPLQRILDKASTIWAISGAIISAWFLGMLLMAMNRAIIRVLEGYHLLNRTPLLGIQRRGYQDLQDRITHIGNQYKQEEQKAGKASSDTEAKYMQLLLDWRTQYPPEIENVLPTKFGNTLRAFETYPRVVYGMDSIPLWPRLYAVLPKEFREAVNDARAEVNFAVNMMLLSLVLIGEYVYLSCLTKTIPDLLLIPVLTAIAAYFFYRMAISSAVRWGDLVKACFDLYRGTLLDLMGIERPETWEQEKETWVNVSQTMLFWDALTLPRSIPKKDAQPDTK